MFLALDEEHIAYSGADLEAIAQRLADQWIKAKQRWINLQQIDLIWRTMNEHLPWVDTDQQVALEQWALVESNIKAGHTDLLLIHPPGKKVATKQIAAGLL